MSGKLEFYRVTCPKQLGNNQAAIGFRLVCGLGEVMEDYGHEGLVERTEVALLAAVRVLCEKAGLKSVDDGDMDHNPIEFLLPTARRLAFTS